MLYIKRIKPHLLQCVLNVLRFLELLLPLDTWLNTIYLFIYYHLLLFYWLSFITLPFITVYYELSKLENGYYYHSLPAATWRCFPLTNQSFSLLDCDLCTHCCMGMGRAIHTWGQWASTSWLQACPGCGRGQGLPRQRAPAVCAGWSAPRRPARAVPVFGRPRRALMCACPGRGPAPAPAWVADALLYKCTFCSSTVPTECTITVRQ